LVAEIAGGRTLTWMSSIASWAGWLSGRIVVVNMRRIVPLVACWAKGLLRPSLLLCARAFGARFRTASFFLFDLLISLVACQGRFRTASFFHFDPSISLVACHLHHISRSSSEMCNKSKRTLIAFGALDMRALEL
jgi:hypothetical protein